MPRSETTLIDGYLAGARALLQVFDLERPRQALSCQTAAEPTSIRIARGPRQLRQLPSGRSDDKKSHWVRGRVESRREPTKSTRTGNPTEPLLATTHYQTKRRLIIGLGEGGRHDTAVDRSARESASSVPPDSGELPRA